MNEQNQRDSIMSMARGAFEERVDYEMDKVIQNILDPKGIGFFEADGGIWKLEAKKNIADYFLKNMGDLIDAGKVVVMQ